MIDMFSNTRGEMGFEAFTRTLHQSVALQKCSMCSEVCVKARKCGMCAKLRTPAPAYYCSEVCAKRHWKEHKAWHAQVEQDLGAFVPEKNGMPPEAQYAATMADSDSEYVRLVGRGLQARIRGNYRGAVKLLTKAIRLVPAQPLAHLELGSVHFYAADFTEAVPHYKRGMDLSDLGTESHDEETWADCAMGAFTCIWHPEGRGRSTPLPPQMDNASKIRLAADRVIAVHPDSFKAYQMRAYACGLYEAVYDRRHVPTNDLRQAVRDQRRVVELLIEEGNRPEDVQREQEYLRLAEAKLRERIAADVAASIAAVERASVS